MGGLPGGKVARFSTGHETIGIKWPWLLLGPVLLGVHLRGFTRMVRRMMRVPVGGMGVVGRFFVVSLVVMHCSFFVMTRSVLVMLRCLTVMFGRLLRHFHLLFHLRSVVDRVVMTRDEGSDRNSQQGACHFELSSSFFLFWVQILALNEILAASGGWACGHLPAGGG